MLPPGAVSKEEHINVDALWTFDTSHHDTSVASDSVGYTRNIQFTTSYINSPDRALVFPGDQQSYMYISNINGGLDGNHMGSWWFYINPDPGLSYGCILEYQGDCTSTGLSVRFKNSKIEFNARTSGGVTIYGTSQTSIPSGQWTYVGIMWHEVYPEIRVYSFVNKNQLS